MRLKGFSFYRPKDDKASFFDRERSRPHPELLVPGIKVVSPSWEEPVKYYFNREQKLLRAPYSEFKEYGNIRAALLLSVRVSPDLEKIAAEKKIQIDCLRGFELARAHFYTTRIAGEPLLEEPYMGHYLQNALRYCGIFQQSAWRPISTLMSALGILGSILPDCLSSGKKFENDVASYIDFCGWEPEIVSAYSDPAKFATAFTRALEIFVKNPFSFKAMEQAAAIMTPFTPPEDKFPRPGPGAIPGESEGKDKKKKRTFSVAFKAKTETGRKIRGAMGQPPTGDPQPWGKMSVIREPMTVPVAGRLKGKRSRCTAEGAIPLRMDRRLSDAAIFKTRRHVPGGTLLIDHSGSMCLSGEQVEEIINLLPAAKIAVYNGEGRRGYLRIVAAEGKRTKNLDPKCHGNIIDLPALQWLARQEGPKIWVSDGIVTGEDEFNNAEMVWSCQRFIGINGILWAENLDEAISFAKELKIQGEDITGTVGRLLNA